MTKKEKRECKKHDIFQDEMIGYMYNHLIKTKRGSSAGRAVKKIV